MNSTPGKKHAVVLIAALLTIVLLAGVAAGASVLFFLVPILLLSISLIQAIAPVTVLVPFRKKDSPVYIHKRRGPPV